MINNSPFDDHIKRQLSELRPDVPPHIWENINAKKEKRKPAGLWLRFFNNRSVILLLLIIAAGGTIWMANTLNNQDNKKNISFSKSNNTHTADIDNKSIKTGLQPNEKPLAETVPVKDLQTESKDSKAGKSSGETEKDETYLSLATSTQQSTVNKINQVTGNEKTENTETSIIAENKLRNNNEPKFNNSTSIKKAKIINASPKEQVAAEDGEEDIPVYLTGKEDELQNKTNVQREEISLSSSLLNLNVSFTAKIFNPGIKAIEPIRLNIPCPAMEKNAAGNKRYVEVYGGPDYAFRSLEDTGNSGYLQKRKESARFSSAFSVGLRYTKVFNNGMSFRTGINYSQVNEKFKFSQGNIIQLVYITDANGDTTGNFATTGTRYKITLNKYRTLDIPLLIGYELGNGRVHANINAGLIINAYSWQKGDLLDTSYQPVNITTGKTSSPYQFKTNIGIGFLGAFSCYYKLNDKLHLLAEPYFRYNLSPSSKAELTLKQKYNTAGLRIGARLDF